MPIFKRAAILAFTVIFISLKSVYAQPDRTVGLILNEPEASPGYTLFAPLRGTTTYLIDMNGDVVYSWDSEIRPGNSVYLLDDGRLLRPTKKSNEYINAGGSGGRIQLIEPDNTVSWSFVYSDSLKAHHHDVEYLPNGNILLVAWQARSQEEAIAAGRDPGNIPEGAVWPLEIVEVKPVGESEGEIVWEWHTWDHLIQDIDPTKANYGVVSEHPELIDINYGPPEADWLHTNAIDYNPDLDQIIVSVRHTNELWVIDHSTTTEEAAGHSGGQYGRGGDLLYRWGNPEAYGRGTSANRKFFLQHDTQWIEPGLPGAGNILVFNNGAERPTPAYSSVEELVPPINETGFYELPEDAPYGPFAPLWNYTSDGFYSSFISGAQRLPNGNTLICAGAQGEIFEITQSGEVVWKYVNPVIPEGPLHMNETIPDGPIPGSLSNLVFRATRISPDHPGLAFLDLESQGPIELGPIVDAIEQAEVPAAMRLTSIFPNPARETATLEIDLDRAVTVRVDVSDMLGRNVFTLSDGDIHATGTTRIDLPVSELAPGVYLVNITSQAGSAAGRLVVSR